ncbi:putative membrane protein [Acinetobacter baumannii 4749]|nr:putative membrane protein [Acinetobacter baumannii 4749]
MPPRQSLIHQQNLWKTFFVFLLPLIATNILQNLSGTINTIFVGQMMGVDAIAAVSVFSPFCFYCLRLLSAFQRVLLF